MKKRIVTTILMLAMAFSLCACGGNGGEENKNTENKNTESSQMKEETEKDSETEKVEDGKIEYKVTVVDANGAPVAGTMVQVCNASTCFAPVQTDANGVATFRLEESNEYKAKLMTASEDSYIYFEAGKTELTITVQ